MRANNITVQSTKIRIMSVAHACEKRLYTQPFEISKEQFAATLSASIQPCKRMSTAAAEAFFLSERLAYSVVGWFVRVGARYYKFYNTSRLDASEAIEMVARHEVEERARREALAQMVLCPTCFGYWYQDRDEAGRAYTCYGCHNRGRVTKERAAAIQKSRG